LGPRCIYNDPFSQLSYLFTRASFLCGLFRLWIVTSGTSLFHGGPLSVTYLLSAPARRTPFCPKKTGKIDFAWSDLLSACPKGGSSLFWRRSLFPPRFFYCFRGGTPLVPVVGPTYSWRPTFVSISNPAMDSTSICATGGFYLRVLEAPRFSSLPSARREVFVLERTRSGSPRSRCSPRLPDIYSFPLLCERVFGMTHPASP